jgi:hypothetical protein
MRATLNRLTALVNTNTEPNSPNKVTKQKALMVVSCAAVGSVAQVLVDDPYEFLAMYETAHVLLDPS